MNVNKAAAVKGFAFDRLFLIKMVLIPMNSDESKANRTAMSNILLSVPDVRYFNEIGTRIVLITHCIGDYRIFLKTQNNVSFFKIS